MNDPMKAKGIIVVENWIDESVLGAWRFLTWEDLVSMIREGVESGTIKGEVVMWCSVHQGNPSDCEHKAIYDEFCDVTQALVIGPVSDGGSET